MSSRYCDGRGESDGGRLLEEIEAISKALYLHKGHTNSSFDLPDRRFESNEEELLVNETRRSSSSSSSSWNWKKSLKALTHIRHRKFNCVFFLKVHSIEGLPSSFNGYSLHVHWKRKDEVLHTRPSKVFRGVAEFDETLIHKTSLSGGRSLANNSAKYDQKLYMVYVSMVGAPRLEFGKHWIDLTRILPLTLEELEGDKCSGNWSTSFRLAGNARGASLNVSFSFLVTKDDPMKLSGPENVVELLKLLHDRSRLSTYDAPFTSSNLNRFRVDTGIFDEVNPKLELSKSISVLYSKMDEVDHSGSEFAKQFEVKTNEEQKSAEVIGGDSYESFKFSIVECGIELAVQTTEGSKSETVSLDEVVGDDKVATEFKSSNTLKDAECDIHVDDSIRDEFKYEESKLKLKVEEVSPEDLSSDSDLKNSPSIVGELLEEENDIDNEEDCTRRSLSLDESYKSVASDFLKLLGLENGSARFSDPDISSPRERLLREFEEESLLFGNPLLDFSGTEEWQDNENVDMLESASGDFDFSIRVAEEGQEKHQSLRNRRNVEILENLETEVLMREWGLDERDFEHSPHYCSSGFGSPIELPPEDEPPKLPSLGDGFGAFLKMNGWFLRLMSPWLSQKTSIGQSLAIQCSDPVVLPNEMGRDIMEISQNLAMAGTKNLSILTKKLMPLDDITGKTLHQMISSWDSCGSVSCCRRNDPEGLPSYPNNSSLRSLLDFEMHQELVSPDDLAFLAMDKIETLLIEGLRIQSGFTDGETPRRIGARPFHCVSACGPRRPNRDGSCSSEGLKELQFIDRPETANDVVGLMDLCITLKNWLKLDAGNINDDDDPNGRHIMKTLVAHGANYADIVERLSVNKSGVSSKEMGLFKNKLVVALMVQLRDHLRDYEPVGCPMMCIMEVERFFIDTARDTVSEMSCINKENETLQAQGHRVHAFKLDDIHLLGVNSEPNRMQFWGTTTQQQSGSRWLLSSGMGRNFKLPISKSKAIVTFSSKAPTGDILWSISSDIHGEGMISASTASSSYKRNFDVVIPIRS